MRKKLISVMLSVAMTASLLAGCGSEPAQESKPQETTEAARDRKKQQNRKRRNRRRHLRITENCRFWEQASILPQIISTPILRNPSQAPVTAFSR